MRSESRSWLGLVGSIAGSWLVAQRKFQISPRYPRCTQTTFSRQRRLRTRTGYINKLRKKNKDLNINQYFKPFFILEIVFIIWTFFFVFFKLCSIALFCVVGSPNTKSIVMLYKFDYMTFLFENQWIICDKKDFFKNLILTFKLD